MSIAQDGDSRTVLVTGVTGSVGSRLAQQLVNLHGCKVRGLSRRPNKGRELASMGVDMVAGDITDAPTVLAAMAGCEWVFHCAGWVSEAGVRTEAWSVNVGGTKHVVDAARQVGIERLVHVSTCAVYGSLQQLNIDESTPRRRRGDPYADSKIGAEEVVFAAYRDEGLPVVVPRPSQVYGPGSMLYTIRPLQAIRTGKLILVDGGRSLCKPIFIDNLVDGLIACVKTDTAVGEAINLSDGVAVPWRDFFGAYGRMLGVEKLRSVPYRVAWLAACYEECGAKVRRREPAFRRATINTFRSRNSFSIRKANELLKWEPRVKLEEGMRRTEVWLRTNGYLD